jgi:hypothetical protein
LLLLTDTMLSQVESRRRRKDSVLLDGKASGTLCSNDSDMWGRLTLIILPYICILLLVQSRYVIIYQDETRIVRTSPDAHCRIAASISAKPGHVVESQAYIKRDGVR